MKVFPNFSYAILAIVLIRFTTYPQECRNLDITFHSDISSTCNFMVMTMIHDALDRPYLYVANKEGGLKIYNISIISNPSLAAVVPTSLYENLHVMNISQGGNYLYLAIGNSFTNPQKGGMAIVDITNPDQPVVTDYYVVPGSASGGGIVKTEGDYAYLGAMGSGLVILDISDKNNIQFVSQFIPDINFPAANPNQNLYNARGMEVNNSIVYLCYDAGGLRIIDCTNKSVPVETGRFANPALYVPFNLPRAYNNIVLDDSLAYVTVDYCGVEVLNISDPKNIKLTAWWNPCNCPGNNWFTSPVHANEIQFNKDCRLLFLSTGKSDMYVIDISDPTHPDSCSFYGGVSNGIGTWGLGLYKDEIYLSYICTLGIPFVSDWTGVKILTYTTGTTGNIEKDELPLNYELKQNYPNPFNPTTIIKYHIPLPANGASPFRKGGFITIKVYDIIGNEIATLVNEEKPAGSYEIEFDGSKLSSGVYFYKLESGEFVETKKLILMK